MIKCGDLIYDSYIRFENKPTVNISDISLICYIHDCYNQIYYYEKLSANLRIENYYSTYSTYISHGIPVRVFLKNSINVKIVRHTEDANYEFKALDLNDCLHVKSHWNYIKILNNLSNKNEIALKGYSYFKSRFEGVNDLSYMKNNQYIVDDYSFSMNESYDGIVFMHDFFDSPHIYRSMVFEDFYEWISYIIDFTIKHSLNIGFKPHPNQLPESKKVIQQLKNKYSSINWINENISNKYLFNSGIKYGLSVYGTVLTELAFHNIKPISCGDNPASDFSFTFQAKTRFEYENLILNYKSLKFPDNLQQELGEYYFMNYLHKNYDQKY
jgi:hypothetical protein